MTLVYQFIIIIIIIIIITTIIIILLKCSTYGIEYIFKLVFNYNRTEPMHYFRGKTHPFEKDLNN
jgi:hypothetical protein